MAKFLGIDLVPLRIPFERRKQSTMVLFIVSLYFVLPFTVGILLILMLFTSYYLVSLGYVTWIIYDVLRKTSSKGGRRWQWFREHSMWHSFRDYFPVSMVKSEDLDPKKNYIFCVHPHGIFGLAACCNFATEATGFKEYFPGLTPHLLTLTTNFSLPIVREILLWLGVCDVSKQSIRWILTKQGKGNIAAILVGGAEESLESKPGCYTLTLLNRKGFVKLAICSGASLVPVFSFGETDLFQQAANPEGSFLRNFQEKFKHLFGFAPPIFYGRGLLNYTFGMMPYRKPMHTVVGAAIDVEQIDEPSTEVIDKYHKMYIQGLTNLFNKHKTNYGIPEDEKLKII